MATIRPCCSEPDPAPRSPGAGNAPAPASHRETLPEDERPAVRSDAEVPLSGAPESKESDR